MDFMTDLTELVPPQSFKVDLVGLKLPTNRDVYIRSLQKQIIEQYSAARMFMDETETNDWKHWFEKFKDAEGEQRFEWSMRGNFLECALFYYNVVIDLSWAMCYIAAEYSVETKDDGRSAFEGMVSIEEAWDLLVKAQRNVTPPTSESNPFGYLKIMNPKFSGVIDSVIDFWTHYQSSQLRQLYNYCKHRGKPFYTELTASGNPPKLFAGYIKTSQSFIETPTATGDVMMKVSIKETLDELKAFDDEQLFPYVKDLFGEIVRIVDPSPLVM